MIQINLNGQPKDLQTSLTLSALLKDSSLTKEAVAVAINSEIIPRSEYEKITLQDKDCVEIVRAVGGG